MTVSLSFSFATSWQPASHVPGWRRSGPAPDVARLGATITFRQEDQVNVTLPREALAALRSDPLVRYVQAVAGAGAPLIGEPEEPTPGAPRRLVPHATAGSQSWSRAYSYDDAGNIITIGAQEFVYDALGRLTEMATSGTPTEQYGYDRYGNQTSRMSGGVTQPIDTDATTNRLSTGYTYDSAGDVKTGDGYTLSYDALQDDVVGAVERQLVLFNFRRAGPAAVCGRGTRCRTWPASPSPIPSCRPMRGRW